MKELLDEAENHYSAQEASSTTAFRGVVEQNNPAFWTVSGSRPSRSIDTVILEQRKKQAILRDINEYLHPSTRQWYSDHGIPYRRGYLFSGAPGTGKTTLSSAIAGVFGMDIYVIGLLDPKLTETQLTCLFSCLPIRCVLLLEDVDAAGIVRDETKKHPGGNISLSALLNAIDGISAPDGRVLIMTSNHAEALDPALVRPGRVDLRVEFELPTTAEVRALFLSIYGSLKDAKAKAKAVQTGVGASADRFDGDNKGQQSLKVLADEFAAAVPSDRFSVADVQGFLLQHKYDPRGAVEKVRGWCDSLLGKL